MKGYLLALVYCILIQIQPNAQNIVSAGSRSNSLSNASVAIEDIWAYNHNPAATARLKETGFGLSYENRFLLREFQNQGFVFAQPLKHGVISVGANFYGYRQFKSYRGGIGYALPLAKFLAAGVQLNYQGIQLNENYGSRHTMTAEAGLLAQLTSKWKLGFSVFNVSRTKLNDFQNERIESTFRLGLSYEVTKQVLILVETSKTITDQLRMKVGVEYQPLRQFFIRLGVQGAPMEYAFGFGYRWKIIQLDAGSTYHQILGWTPNVNLNIFIPKKTNNE